MPLTLEDLQKIPDDATPEHLQSLGLLPPPAPVANNIIPPAKVDPALPNTPLIHGSDGWLRPIHLARDAAASRPRIPSSAVIGDETSPSIGNLAAPGVKPMVPPSLMAESAPGSPAGGGGIGNLKPLVAPGATSAPPAAGAPPAADIMGESAPPPVPGAMDLGGVSAPALPKLDFKGRQALPTVSPGAPAGSAAQHEAELARMKDQDANPWGTGENHPGVIGKIGHVLAKIGNIAGDVLAPGTMALVPGTDLNRSISEDRENRLRGESQERETAQAGEQARAQSEKDKAAYEQERNRLTDRKLDIEENKTKPESIDKAAVEAKTKEINPATGKNWTDYDARVELANDINAGKKGAAPTAAEERQRYEKIRAQEILNRDRTRTHVPIPAEDLAWATSYEKAATLTPFAQVQAQAPVKATDRSDKSYDKNVTRLEKLSSPVQQTQARLGRLMDTLKQRSPAADAFVGPEMLTIMAGGQGSGLRMSEAEIARIVGGRSAWESLKASLNKFNTDPEHANSITDDQRAQMQKLADALQDKLVQKTAIIDKAHDDLLDTDDPKEHRRILVEAQAKLSDIDAGPEAAKKREDMTRPAATANAPQPPEGKTVVYDPKGAPSFVRTDKVDAFLKDPKYKDWSKNAPRSHK